MIKVAACDDNVGQLEEATVLLEEFSESRRLDLSITALHSVKALFEDGRAGEFDIVFMDIDFDGSPDGIEAVRRLNGENPDCQVVYLTNYLQYSVDVYRTDHVWFVLKNQFEQRLSEIFDKLDRIRESRHEFIVIATKADGIIRLNCGEICYLERKTRVTQVVTRTGTYEVLEKLAVLYERLPHRSFAYSHSSFIVNMALVTALHDNAVILDGGASIPISRRYAKHFRESYFEWAKQWTV
jgi:DNA-binding LytR/AlgR family response regulator